MTRCLSMAVLSFLALVAFVDVSFAKDEWTKETLAEVKKNVEDEKAVLVDVRETEEWDEGHLETSLLLPLSALKKGVKAEDLAERLPEDKIIYTFCVVGKRAVTAAKLLAEHGYEVRPLKPGYEELRKAGFKKAKE